MNFVAIDVETANPNLASICQVGIATFRNGQLAETWSSLVDPEDDFSAMNIAVHGITPRMVSGMPTFCEIEAQLRALLEGSVSVSHTYFDRVALARAYAKHGITRPLATTWLDSARVVRRQWSDVAEAGYGLAEMAKRIGYDFRHHDALEDAKAAGEVLVAAIAESGQSLDFWLERVEKPIDPSASSQGSAVRRGGNPEGDLFGEVVVFTGALQFPRNEAADLAAGVGCRVHESVTKKTTLLVVGDQDVRKLNGEDRSAKHRKAEELIAKGVRIQILGESDFLAVVRTASSQS